MNVSKPAQFSPGEAEAQKPVWPEVILKNKTFLIFECLTGTVFPV